jgi:hypothetical protein
MKNRSALLLASVAVLLLAGCGDSSNGGGKGMTKDEFLGTGKKRPDLGKTIAEGMAHNPTPLNLNDAAKKTTQ